MNSTDKIYGYRPFSSQCTVSKKLDMLRVLCQLCRLRISAFAALSALTGSVLTTSELTSIILINMAGVFSLACGASALNQYQERHIDARMMRTASRPIPLGIIKKSHALYIAVSLIVTGILIILLSGGWIVAGLGLFALFWYNLVYTNLKQVTAFAAVPGAIVGAIPPAMGWVTGGGSLNNYALLPICFFFFIWQVPHFWFLLFTHEEDYKRSDIPALVKIFNRDQIGRVAIIWTMAAAVSLFLIPFFGIILSDIAMLLLGITSVWLVWCGSSLLRRTNEDDVYYAAFKRMNGYMLFVMAVFNIGRLFNV